MIVIPKSQITSASTSKLENKTVYGSLPNNTHHTVHPGENSHRTVNSGSTANQAFGLCSGGRGLHRHLSSEGEGEAYYIPIIPWRNFQWGLEKGSCLTALAFWNIYCSQGLPLTQTQPLTWTCLPLRARITNVSHHRRGIASASCFNYEPYL